MSLTILNVAYPLAPVGDAAVGGAEQVLSQIDRGLVRAGHRSLVIACAGSRIAGTLITTPRPPPLIDDWAYVVAHDACRREIEKVLRAVTVDLVHFHGVDCLQYLPPPSVRTLVTLHLPVSCYPPDLFRCTGIFFNCVSATQKAGLPEALRSFPAIPNGISFDEVPGPWRRRRFAMMLGRICPEKGFHLGLEAGLHAGVPCLLAGKVFGYPAHQRYYRDEITPRLDGKSRFIGEVGGRRKRSLLAAAHCLLVPSQLQETSSLVAMEALACGTPVIAFRKGALPEIIEHGRTGFLVSDVREMADAIGAATHLLPEDCRGAARRRFSAQRMIEQYFALYSDLVEQTWFARLRDTREYGPGAGKSAIRR